MALEAKFDFEEIVEKLAKVPKIARLAAVTALLIGIVAGYYFIYYQTAHQELANLQGQSEELQRKLNKVRVVASNLADFEAEVAGLQRSLDKALKQLPNRKQFEDLLRDISTTGKKVGVTIRSIERKGEVPQGFYAEVPFVIEIEGTYHDIARFFEQIAGLPRIVNMGAMDVSIQSEDEFQTTLKVRGTATAFRFLKKG